MANPSTTAKSLQRDARRRAKAFDAPDGYSGQEYDLARERAEGAKRPSGMVDPKAKRKADHQEVGGMSRNNGRRASFDPASGEVHGSGATDGEGDGRKGFFEDG